MPVVSYIPPAKKPSSPPPSGEGELSRILKLKVPVIVKLAERQMSLAEIMRLSQGSIIEFAKSSEEPLELLINNKCVGLGEAVKVSENFGLRVTHVGDVKQLIKAMRG